MKITLLNGRTSDLSNRFEFNLKVIKSPLAKRLTLRIDEKNHQAVLTQPKYCSQSKALAFLETHRDWIVNMLARLPKAKTFSNGDVFFFFGQQYIILHNPSFKGGCFDDGFLKIGGNPEFLHRRVTDFLKQQALKKLSNITLKKAKQLQCRVCGVSVKDTKSRWGSCSTLGNINYNWRICLAPDFVIDYLISHEVSHLKHPDHSANFWQTVESLCPNYSEGRHWLKIKGKDLYQYI